MYNEKNIKHREHLLVLLKYLLTWRQLSLDGRGTPVKSVINTLPLLLLQFPLFLLKLQII